MGSIPLLLIRRKKMLTTEIKAACFGLFWPKKRRIAISFDYFWFRKSFLNKTRDVSSSKRCLQFSSFHAETFFSVFFFQFCSKILTVQNSNKATGYQQHSSLTKTVFLIFPCKPSNNEKIAFHPTFNDFPHTALPKLISTMLGKIERPERWNKVERHM